MPHLWCCSTEGYFQKLHHYSNNLHTFLFDIEQFNQYLQNLWIWKLESTEPRQQFGMPMLSCILESFHEQQMESQLFYKMCIWAKLCIVPLIALNLNICPENEDGCLHINFPINTHVQNYPFNENKKQKSHVWDLGELHFICVLSQA